MSKIPDPRQCLARALEPNPVVQRLARSYVLLADLTEDAIQGGAVFTLRSSSDGLFAATLQHPGSPQTGPRYCVVRGTLGAVLAELDTKWREWQRRGNQP